MTYLYLQHTGINCSRVAACSYYLPIWQATSSDMVVSNAWYLKVMLSLPTTPRARKASKINARPKPPSQPQHRAGCTRAACCNCPSARLACLLLVVAPRRKAPAKIIEDSDNGSFHLADYESEERDPLANPQASDNEHEDDDDDPQPTRGKRTHQLSECETQRLADAAEAAEHKATKAAKAAEKQHRLETGARPAPVPFVYHEVGTNQPKKKLVERSSCVPMSPGRRPLVVANGSCPILITGTTITDWRQYVVHPIPEDYDDCAEPRLYDINGKRLPNRARLDLRTVTQDITQVPEAGLSSAPSRGRLCGRSISPESPARRHIWSLSPVAERTLSPIAGDKRARAPEDGTVIHTAQAQTTTKALFHSDAQPMVSDLPAVPSLSQAARPLKGVQRGQCHREQRREQGEV
ncbi:hypothetical protein GGX14DRAFT_678408 [Mycena pura]|uniref:Uncharacterized protein n=1 Tax=Mycena pura TaxID=153505 RepID=A0AAD6UXS7_9AGAR|nr:hypothetical protein GGX14DRAFT_678408 [Mycena pura]